MALTLTEDLIRNRVGLQHDNLEDVKSLALPGTYHEKVVALGSSLRKFTRLKHLDLSRNNIASLQGIENLQLLEKLNLYYNNIQTLDELKRLKNNPNLKELDLRLNPVTRTETDYRLYLIHMLPNLQKLDDRGVRDRERQGALIHFSSSQATEMTVQPRQVEIQQRAPNPRAEHVKTLGSGRVLDDDDVAILDLIASTGGDLGKQRPLTGSNVKEPTVQDYSITGDSVLDDDDDVAILDLIASTGGDLGKQRPLTGSNVKEPTVQDYSITGLKSLEPMSLDGPQIEAPAKKKQAAEVDEVMAAYRKKYPNIPESVGSNSEHRPQNQADPNLDFKDEADAYHKFKSHGYFTPNPAGGDVNDPSKSFVQTERDSYPPPPTRAQLERSQIENIDVDSDEEVETDRRPHRRSRSVPAERLEHNKPESERYIEESRQGPMEVTVERLKPPPSTKELPEARLFLFKILDMVDRYWNGSKSLHKNNKFKALAYDAIDDYLRSSVSESQQHEIRQLRDEIMQTRKDNSRIRRQEELTKSSLEDSAATEAHLKASLQKAFTDVEILKDKAQSYAQENKRLQQKLQQLEQYNSQLGSTTVNQTQIDEIQKQNDLLKKEVEKQSTQTRQYKQLQELSSMLQESHKSLVQTNGHLLQELEQERQRHQHEVEQLNWSYNQLKKTLASDSHVIKGDNNASVIMYDSDN